VVKQARKNISRAVLDMCARSSVDRASVFGTEGRGFESLRAYHFLDMHVLKENGEWY
jgi:hypothetical protein